MKKNILQYTGVIIASFILQVSVVHAGVPEAVTYLQTQELDVTNAIALIEAGETVDISFLKTTDTTASAIGVTKPIMAIVAAGEDPRTYADTDLVVALKNYYDSTQTGDIGLVNDDIWAILALISAGEKESSEVTGMVDFVISNQNLDGGWSYNVGGDSSTDDTAAAVMALIASGILSTDSVIVDAKNYIAGNQNDDGGFLSNPLWGTDSNSSTDAWVIAMINALGEDMTSWTKNGNTPIDHVMSLQDIDGGYWWVTEGTSELNNKNYTADVVTALLGKTFPTVIMEAPAVSGVMVEYRFEGSLSQICSGETSAVNVIDVIENAALTCGFDHEYTLYSFGSMLTRINTDDGNWGYYVNNSSAFVGAADYMLNEADSVLWYFAGVDFGWLPTRLIIQNDAGIFSIGDTVLGIVEYFDESNSTWLTLDAATIVMNGVEYTTDSDGGFSITLNDPGVFELIASKEGYIRTDIHSIAVGDTSESILLSAQIVQSIGTNPSDGTTPNTSIGFTISPATLAFGQITPGMETTKQVSVNNVGTDALTLRAQIMGNSIFDFIKILNIAWKNFEMFLGIDKQESLDVSLSIPTAYTSYGSKEGSLIFWAIRAE